MSREKAGYPLIGYFRQQQRLCGRAARRRRTSQASASQVTQVGSSFHYSLGLLADKYGFKLADVKVAAAAVAVERRRRAEGRNPSMPRCCRSRPRASLMDSGGAKFLGWVGDETPWQLGAVFASPKTLTNKVLVTKLLAALVQAPTTNITT